MTSRRALAAALALLAAGCSHSAAPPSCTRPETATQGVLTLATGAVTRDPWVVGGTSTTSGDPRDGKGYDAAVGYALGKRLGFAAGDVRWVSVPFSQALAKGPKAWDVDINQVSVRDDRRVATDLSSSYYDVQQVLVTLRGRQLEHVGSVDDLQGQQLAFVEGTPAGAALAALDLDPLPRAYAGLDQARGAVSSGAAQGLVTDYETARQLDQVETMLVDGEAVALLPSPVVGERYGLVLPKDSPLTGCVDQALAAMRDDGTLRELERTWLVEHPGLTDLR